MVPKVYILVTEEKVLSNLLAPLPREAGVPPSSAMDAKLKHSNTRKGQATDQLNMVGTQVKTTIQE